MNELLLIALTNFVLCVISWFICVCRLNTMRKESTIRMSVKMEYAIGAAAMIFSAGRPLIGEWPGYASLVVGSAYLWSLLASSPAWRNDTPPDVAFGRGLVAWIYLKLRLFILIEHLQSFHRKWIQKKHE